MFFMNISEAKSNLSQLVKKVCDGEEVVIGKSGKPIARLIPYEKDMRPRKGGQWKGKVSISPEFDELPEDIINSFYGD